MLRSRLLLPAAALGLALLAALPAGADFPVTAFAPPGGPCCSPCWQERSFCLHCRATKFANQMRCQGYEVCLSGRCFHWCVKFRPTCCPPGGPLPVAPVPGLGTPILPAPAPVSGYPPAIAPGAGLGYPAAPAHF
jgi:hypothetical protein